MHPLCGDPVNGKRIATYRDIWYNKRNYTRPELSENAGGCGCRGGFVMAEGKIYIYGGTGHGKSPAAIGCGLIAAAGGASVVIIQFLKGKGLTGDEYARRLEPEIKLFRFEKSDENFAELPKEKQEEEVQNIRNGLNFAKKVLNTGGCDMLILDEVLGLIDNHIITPQDLKNVIDARDGETDIIMTGISMDQEICALADYVTQIVTVK